MSEIESCLHSAADWLLLYPVSIIFVLEIHENKQKQLETFHCADYADYAEYAL